VLASACFAFVGFRTSAAVFAAVALMPLSFLQAPAFFELPGMRLTLGELFGVITPLLFCARPQPLYRSRFTSLLLVL